MAIELNDVSTVWPSPSERDTGGASRSEASPRIGNWIADHHDRRAVWSDAMYGIFGVTHETFDPTFANIAGRLVPEDRRALMRQVQAWGIRAAPLHSIVRLVRPDGAVRLVELRGWSAASEATGVRLTRGTCHDVTEGLNRVPAPASGDDRGELVDALAEAEGRERLRIAADIHDDPIQALDAVSLRLSRAAGEPGSAPVAALLASVQHDLHDVADRLRRVTFELLPPDHRDLGDALRAFCETLWPDGLTAVEIEGDVGDLAPERRRFAYRLVQEPLRNARKHSQADHVRIELGSIGDQLVIRVIDDGIGIEADGEPTGHDHAGLRILRRRAEAAGGIATVGPGPGGRGTTLELRLPRAESR